MEATKGGGTVLSPDITKGVAAIADKWKLIPAFMQVRWGRM